MYPDTANYHHAISQRSNLDCAHHHSRILRQRTQPIAGNEAARRDTTSSHPLLQPSDQFLANPSPPADQTRTRRLFPRHEPVEMGSWDSAPRLTGLTSDRLGDAGRGIQERRACESERGRVAPARCKGGGGRERRAHSAPPTLSWCTRVARAGSVVGVVPTVVARVRRLLGWRGARNG